MTLWRIGQVGLWIAGLTIVLLLLLAPAIGIHAFWNILIPVAPALLAFAPGLWRNVCPLASSALVARHARLSGRRRIPIAWQRRLGLIGVLLLFAVIPLRHVFLNTDGPATAIVLLALGAASLLMGLVFEWKSGWCTGLCPVHPVEKLYGSAPLASLPNTHCGPCRTCVRVCPDSVVDPQRRDHPLLLTLMAGAFPGFVWGWFQVPDFVNGQGWLHLSTIYGPPIAGATVTLILFLLISSLVSNRNRRRVVRGFAAATLACYYAYRLPALIGFGPFPGDGMLVDLSETVPAWTPHVMRAVTTLLLAWWYVGLARLRRAWLIRPPIAAST